MQPNANGSNTGPQELEAAPLSFDTKGNLAEDWQDVRRAGFRVWVAITLIAAPTLPTLVTVTTSERRAGMDEAQAILQVFLLTFPLTLGVAIDTFILLLLAKYDAFPNDRAKGGGPYNGQMMLFGGLTLIFALSASLGNWLGMGVGSVEMPKAEIKGHPMTWLNWLLGLLKNYFVLYGPQLFFSSLIVGAFTGWATAMKLLPNFLPGGLKQAEEQLLQNARARMEEQRRQNEAAIAADQQEHERIAATVQQIVSEHTPTSTADPEKLRRQLLCDLENVGLRKRYLAVRTPSQKWLDEGNVKWLKTKAIAGAIGVIVGLIVPALAGPSKNGGIAALDRMLGGFGLALFLGLLGFLFINMCMGRDRAFWDSERMRGELGPLPPNATRDLAALRKHYLGE
jgi:hypothetical protein